MKIFKMILNCVLPVLLVISITLNVLLLCGFEFTNKNTNKSDTCTSTIEDLDEKEPDDVISPEDKNKVDVEVTFEKESTEEEMLGTLVFEDNNFNVYYLETKNETSDIVHTFRIENKTKKPLTILFTDVIINSQQVYTSGLTCENLLPETDIVEDFVLFEKDWSHFTNSPTNVSFKIKIVNSKSRLDWYETDRINLKVN